MNIWQLKEYIKDLPDDMELASVENGKINEECFWIDSNILHIN